MVGTNHRIGEKGFTLLELMIASVVMAIIFMGLISSLTGSFLATDMANKSTEAQALGRRMLEEAMQLEYGDELLLNGNALITDEGIAAKYEVFETSPGLLTVEVEVCRPLQAVTTAELSAMTMGEFQQLACLEGSRVHFTTMSTGVMQRAVVTDRTEAAQPGDVTEVEASGSPDTGAQEAAKAAEEAAARAAAEEAAKAAAEEAAKAAAEAAAKAEAEAAAKAAAEAAAAAAAAEQAAKEAAEAAAAAEKAAAEIAAAKAAKKDSKKKPKRRPWRGWSW